MKLFRNVAPILAIACIAGQAFAQEEFLDRFGTIRFDTLSNFSFGDGVSYDDLTGARGNCIDLATSTVKKDVVSGSVETSSRVDILTSLSEVERRLKRSLAIEASAKGGLKGVFSAGISGNLLTDYSGVAKSESSTLLVVISIYSDRGREWLDYKIKPEYKSLLNGTPEQQARFVEVCGTHFIRARRLETSIEIVMSVSDLSASSKETLKREAKASLEGSGTFSSGLSIGGKASVDRKIETFEARARQLGNVSITIKGKGTAKLEAVESVIYKSDGKPANIGSYFEKAATLTSELSKGDGAPTYYILQKYPELDASFFDFEKYAFVERGLTALVEANSLLAHYSDIAEINPTFYETHMTAAEEAATSVRDKISFRLGKCLSNGQCSTSVPEVPTPVAMDRALRNGRLVAICGQNIDAFLDGKPVKAMSDIAIVWRGEIGYPNFMVLDTISAFAISPDGSRPTLPEFAAWRDFSVEPIVLRSSDNLDAKGPGRAIAQIANQKLDPTKVVKDGEVDHSFLTSFRKNMADLTYGFQFRDNSGRVFDQVVGRPDMSQCKIVSN